MGGNTAGRWVKHKLLYGSLILLGGFALSIIIAWAWPVPGVGIMGIGILLTVLIGGNVLSEEHDLTAGEIRRAIAVSSIAVFFGLLAFGNTIKAEQGVLKTLLENFWWVIITVIGFYFGGRSAEKIVETLKK